MRYAISTLVILLTAAAASSAAEAHRYRKHHCIEARNGRCIVVHRQRHDDSYDRIRAEAYDPAGSYRGYPDWARYALSPKSNR